MRNFGLTRRLTAGFSFVIIGLCAAGCQKQIQTGINDVGLGGVVQAGQLVGGATKQVQGVQPAGNFLPNPSLLTPGGAGQVDLVYINSAANPASYRTVYLAPVAVLAPPDSQLNAVPLNQRQAVAQTFYKDLNAALVAHCGMTSRPSEGTVKLNFALVDAHLPNAVVNTLATYAPYASTAYDLSSLAFNHGVGYFAGTATAEAYATNASGTVVLWQAVDKRGGTTSSLENTLNTWLDVDHAFQAWAQRLATKMVDFGYCRG
jgi:hypothetical protein